MEKTQVVIVGGGATGAGILWDLTLRGVHAILLEKADLANGATGRCHGLLHSGARYAVKDPDAANECIRENMILRRLRSRACMRPEDCSYTCPRMTPRSSGSGWKAVQKPESPPNIYPARKRSHSSRICQVTSSRLTPVRTPTLMPSRS